MKKNIALVILLLISSFCNAQIISSLDYNSLLQDLSTKRNLLVNETIAVNEDVQANVKVIFIRDLENEIKYCVNFDLQTKKFINILIYKSSNSGTFNWFWDLYRHSNPDTDSESLDDIPMWIKTTYKPFAPFRFKFNYHKGETHFIKAYLIEN